MHVAQRKKGRDAGGIKEDRTTLVDLYQKMLLIRRFEEASAQQYMRGHIRGFLHLYIGEEAIAVGATAALEPQDYIFTHYRDHGHALARGMDPNAAMAELFGKATGSSKGKGGSMHLFDASRNFMGGYAIVAGQIPLATGVAFGERYKGSNAVTLCYLGDGALNEGEFHECVNMAAIWQLPIIFLCENNLYGMGAPVAQIFAPANHIYRIVEPYGIPSKQVDGMDVLQMRSTMQEVVDYVRSGNGPYFVEALAYRFRGHSMSDPAEYRHKEEETLWRARDPIPSFRSYLTEQQGVVESKLQSLDQEVQAVVDAAVAFAEKSPFPEAAELYRDVLATEDRHA